MKKILALLILCTISIAIYSQENMVTLSGGYSWANLDDTDLKATGWRINGAYEFNKGEGSVAQGVSIGYISLKASENVGVGDTSHVDYKVSSLPVCYVPKYFFGAVNAKGFVKGAVGFHHTKFERSGSLGSVEAQDWGFYGGVGAGFMYTVNEKVFINIEYEFAWLSNSSYQSGFMQTAMGGIGFRF